MGTRREFRSKKQSMIVSCSSLTIEAIDVPLKTRGAYSLHAGPVDQYLKSFSWNKVKYRVDKSLAEMFDTLQKVYTGSISTRLLRTMANSFVVIGDCFYR